MTDRSPKVIAFEGAPLTGKTTQVELLEEYLKDEGYEVEVMKRMTEECPTREKLNEWRDKADGFTRELEEVSLEEETETWAQYYREKSEAIESREELDYVLVDRYFLSLIPAQEPAYEEKGLHDLAEEYRDEIQDIDIDMVFVLTLEEGFPERYREREGSSIPEDFKGEVERIQENYRELSRYFDAIEYVSAEGERDEVNRNIRNELEEGGLI